MALHPYLFFTGNCLEAMEFYKTVFGGELMTMPHQDGKGIMHADLSGGDITLLASDGTRTEPYETSFISLTLTGNDKEKLTAAFEKLKVDAKHVDELKVESWGDTFGALTDKFGVDWQFNISAN